MFTDSDIRIVFLEKARRGPSSNIDCTTLVEAMKSQSWGVTFAGDEDELASMASSGTYHLAILPAISELFENDPPGYPGTLHPDESQVFHKTTTPSGSFLEKVMQIDMGLLFLVPDQYGACLNRNRPVAVGITSEQFISMDSPGEQMLSIIRNELDSVIAAQPRYTVFCVDDDEDFLASMEQMLPRRLIEAFPRFHLDFDFFSSPRKALAAAGELARETSDRLAVVICDQVMPEMNGVELLARFKELCPHAQRILLTGHAALESAIDAINSQVLDKYLSKPIEQAADFAASVSGLLREHHFRAARDQQQAALLAQFEFIRAISATGDVAQASEVTARFAREQTGAGEAMVCLLEEGRLQSDDSQTAIRNMILAMGGALEGRGSTGLAAPPLPRGHTMLFTRKSDLPEPSEQWASLPLPIMATALGCNGTTLGLILAAGKPAEKPFTRRERMFLGFIADAASVAISGLLDRKSLEQHYVDTLACLMDTVEARDHYTRGHTERVVELSLALGRRIGLSEGDLKNLRHGACLHDIGKIGVPDAIILKPRALNEREYAVMKEHPQKAFKMLQHLRFLGVARMIIRSHHERFDGGGYPEGLTGEEIPLGARILAIADTYDAMTSTRPYRLAMSQQDALAEIEANAGAQFDPALAAEFVKMMRTSHQMQHTPQVRQAAGQEAAR